jgi:hypothetical protein
VTGQPMVRSGDLPLLRCYSTERTRSRRVIPDGIDAHPEQREPMCDYVVDKGGTPRNA